MHSHTSQSLRNFLELQRWWQHLGAKLDTGWVNWKYGMASSTFMITTPLHVAMICAG